MHFFQSSAEPLATRSIHREEGECLRKGYTVCTRVKKLNMCVNLPKKRTENDFAKRSFWNWPPHKESRSSGRGEPLYDTQEFFSVYRENRFLLVGHTDARWSVLTRFLDRPRHYGQDYKAGRMDQCYKSDQRPCAPPLAAILERTASRLSAVDSAPPRQQLFLLGR